MKNVKRTLSMVLALILALTLLAGCGEQKETTPAGTQGGNTPVETTAEVAKNYKKKIVIGVANPMTDDDPQGLYDNMHATMVNLSHNQLLTYNFEKRELEPELAVEWKAEDAKTAKENEAIEKITKDMEVEIPEAMLDTQADQLVDEWGQRFQAQGLSLDQYFQYTGSNRKQMAEQLKPEAERRIKTRLALEEIVKLENITATEEDFEAEIKKMAEQYRMEPEKLKGLVNDEEKEQMMKDLAVQKAVDFVAENAVEVEKPAEEKKDEKKSDEEAADKVEEKADGKKDAE